MSSSEEEHVPKIIRDRFMDKKKDFCNLLIEQYQKEHLKKLYKDKSPEDKVICPLCGGKFLRQAKSIHAKTKKHQEKIKEIHNYV